MAIANFNLAVNKTYKVKDGEPTADFPSCIAFSKTAETMNKFLKKGDLCIVYGHIATSTYEKDGQKIYKTQVAVDKFEFVPNNRTENFNGGQTELPNSGFFAPDNQQGKEDGFMSFPEDSSLGELPFA